MIETQLKLGRNDQGRLLSAEEFVVAEYEAPYRYERVGGRLVVMSPSDLAHMQVISAILEHLYLYKHAHSDKIELIAPEGWMRTSNHTDRVGDIAIYLETSAADHIYDMVPDLVYEIVSKGSEERDYILKRGEYFDLGVGEYIIVDPFRQVVSVLTRGENDYIGRELKADDLYTTDHLPGFELSIADLPW